MQENEEPQRLCTYSDVSERTGIPVSTLYTMVRKHTVPFVRLGPRIVRFERVAIDKWISQNAVSVRELL